MPVLLLAALAVALALPSFSLPPRPALPEYDPPHHPVRAPLSSRAPRQPPSPTQSFEMAASGKPLYSMYLLNVGILRWRGWMPMEM